VGLSGREREFSGFGSNHGCSHLSGMVRMRIELRCSLLEVAAVPAVVRRRPLRVIAIEPNAETIAVINRRANSSAVLCKISSLHRASTERSSALSPFHEICTPMHTRMKDDKRIKIFIAASPSASAIRSAKR